MAIATQKEVIDERFESLWAQVASEGALSPEATERERLTLAEDIAALEATIAQKKEALDAIDNRQEIAKQKVRALLSTGLGQEAILSAMRVEYRIARPTPVKSPSAPKALAEVSDEDKNLVLSHLDREGMTIADIKKLTNKDAAVLSAALKSLAAEGKIERTGEGRGSKYALA